MTGYDESLMDNQKWVKNYMQDMIPLTSRYRVIRIDQNMTTLFANLSLPENQEKLPNKFVKSLQITNQHQLILVDT
jgi:hypothetical protein